MNTLLLQQNKKQNLITQSFLKKLFFYDQLTGDFIRVIKLSNKTNVGDIAGYMDTAGYIIIKINYIGYKAHRLAYLYMTGGWPKNQIDHDNHIRHDNSWNNIKKDVTRSGNCRNQKLNKNNKTGKTGVHFCNTSKKYVSQITVLSKNKQIGRFLLKKDAIKAREKADIKYGFHENHGRV